MSKRGDQNPYPDPQDAWLPAVAEAIILLKWVHTHKNECPCDNPVLMEKIDRVLGILDQ